MKKEIKNKNNKQWSQSTHAAFSRELFELHYELRSPSLISLSSNLHEDSELESLQWPINYNESARFIRVYNLKEKYDWIRIVSICVYNKKEKKKERILDDKKKSY